MPDDLGVVELFRRLVRIGRIYDLSHAMSAQMPIFPFHAPFFLSLHRRHGDTIRPGDTSFASGSIYMPDHAGTHLDAIGHFSRGGRVYGGADADDIQGPAGLLELDADWSDPAIWRRGLMLDIPAFRGVSALEAGEAVSAEDIQGALRRQEISLERGDAVLVRTGWAQYWDDPERYNGLEGGYPGLDASAGRWLAGQQPWVVGADTHAIEVAPPGDESVHGILIADTGILLLENVRLEELAADNCYEFLFVAMPLRIKGGTGAPVRPIAII